MPTDPRPESSDGIERIDRYSITVDGLTVRADKATEDRIRGLNPQQRQAFLRMMGGGA